MGGLTTAEIANAFLVPEATMAQRISRAKQSIKSSGTPFRLPTDQERTQRLGAVLHVLYLIFNEGYVASVGPQVQRLELSGEAIRLTRALHHLLPDDGEVGGLLALMLLTNARRKARTGPNEELIPLAKQDRTLWDQGEISEGVALITATLSKGSISAYQLQAAIAAVHAEAARAEDTDWPQILALYELLETHVQQSHGDAQSCDRDGHGQGPVGGSQAADCAGPGRTADGPSSPRCCSCLPAGDVRRLFGRDRSLPNGRRTDDESSGTELPPDSSWPAEQSV